MGVGDRMTGVSIIGTEFEREILGPTEVGGIPAIRPLISEVAAAPGWQT